MGKTRMVFIDAGAKVNSSYCNIVFEKGLLPDIRAICRHYRWALQQDGELGHTARTTMDYLKKEHINFIEPHMWPSNSPDIDPVDYTIRGSSSATSLSPMTIQNGGRTEASDSHRVTKTHSVSFITLSMNGVDVLKLLSRMAADTSSIAT